MEDKFTTIRILKTDRDKLEKTGLAGEPTWKTVNRILPETDEYSRLEAIKAKIQQDAREKLEKFHRDQLSEQVSKKQKDMEKYVKDLGLDSEKDDTTPAWNSDKYKKR